MIQYRYNPSSLKILDAPQVVFAIARIFEMEEGPTASVLGTGFLLNKPGLIATAAHVVGLNDDNLVVIIPACQNMDDYQPAVRPLVTFMPAKIIAHDPIRDLAILSVPAITAKANWKVSTSDNVQVGDTLVYYGFPHADSGRIVLTRHDARVGAKILIPSPIIEVKYLVANGLARPGQSGSPVLHQETGNLVAILSGAYAPPSGGRVFVGNTDPATIHQTTHAVSADYLVRMY